MVKTYWTDSYHLDKEIDEHDLDEYDGQAIQVLKLSEVKENFLEKSFIKNELNKFEKENFTVHKMLGEDVVRWIQFKDSWKKLKQNLGVE